MSHGRTVLLGAAGTGTAFAAAVALRRQWATSCRIIGQDINPAGLVTCSLLCDEFIRCPMSADPAFGPHLFEVIEAHRVDTYLPLVPAELSLARLQIQSLEARGVNVLLADRRSPVDLSDKWAVIELARRHNVSVPDSELGFPPAGAGDVFVKPRFGFGSRGAQKMSRAAFEALPEPERAQLLCQEICDAPEVTVDTFVAPGETHAVARERIEVKAGVCVKARVYQDASLTALARHVAESFVLRGAFCFQVMRLGSRWVLTDLNPRPGAGTSMCYVAGSDFHAANFALAWGEDFSRFLRPLSASVLVTRQYADFLTGSEA